MNPDLVYITADLHLGHKNIIKMQPRPYDDIDHMNAELINKINSLPEGAHLFHVGDFIWSSKKGFWELFNRISPHVSLHFVFGNHDSHNMTKMQEELLERPNVIELRDYKNLKHRDGRIILFHYPILVWDQRYRGNIHFHGHCHNNCQYPKGAGRIADVGIDCSGYEIKTLDYWVNHINKKHSDIGIQWDHH